MIKIKKSIHDTEDRFCNEIEVQRRNQTSERKNPTHQTENTVTSLNNMLGEAETRISETEDKILELSQLDKEEKKIRMPQNSVQDIIKRSHIHT